VGEMIVNYIERLRERLAFKIYPELQIYFKAISIFGEMNENKRVVELIEQSNFKNKKAVIDLVITKYTDLNDLKQRLDDASEDQTSSDAS